MLLRDAVLSLRRVRSALAAARGALVRPVGGRETPPGLQSSPGGPRPWAAGASGSLWGVHNPAGLGFPA